MWCVLELDTFFLGRDMITQNFLPIVIHTNLMKVPATITAIVISWQHKSSLWIKSFNQLSWLAYITQRELTKHFTVKEKETHTSYIHYTCNFALFPQTRIFLFHTGSIIPQSILTSSRPPVRHILADWSQRASLVSSLIITPSGNL